MTTKSERKGPLSTIEETAREAIEQGEKVWLAGLGVLARAQDEGREFFEADKSKMFDELVEAGRDFAQRAKDSGESQFASTRETIRDSFDKAREQARSTYDRAIDQAESGVDKVAETLGIDQIFDRRVQKALERMGYPTKSKFDALNRKVNALKKEVEKPKPKPKAAKPKVVKKEKVVAAEKKTA